MSQAQTIVSVWIGFVGIVMIGLLIYEFFIDNSIKKCREEWSEIYSPVILNERASNSTKYNTIIERLPSCSRVSMNTMFGNNNCSSEMSSMYLENAVSSEGFWKNGCTLNVEDTVAQYFIPELCSESEICVGSSLCLKDKFPDIPEEFFITNCDFSSTPSIEN